MLDTRTHHVSRPPTMRVSSRWCTSNTVVMWHNRLMHLNEKDVWRLAQDGIINVKHGDDGVEGARAHEGLIEKEKQNLERSLETKRGSS